jgi:hypothetical protein
MAGKIAKDNIYFNGFVAYAKGEVVPQHVLDGPVAQNLGWSELVVGADTKTAKEIASEITSPEGSSK